MNQWIIYWQKYVKEHPELEPKIAMQQAKVLYNQEKTLAREKEDDSINKSVNSQTDAQEKVVAQQSFTKSPEPLISPIALFPSKKESYFNPKKSEEQKADDWNRKVFDDTNYKLFKKSDIYFLKAILVIIVFVCIAAVYSAYSGAFKSDINFTPEINTTANVTANAYVTANSNTNNQYNFTPTINVYVNNTYIIPSNITINLNDTNSS